MTATVLDQYEHANWAYLPDWVREAASVLGYTDKLWDKDKDAPTETKDWGELTFFEQEAATKLGYTAEIWDDDDSSSSSSSSSNDSSDSDDEKNTTSTVLDQYENADWEHLPDWVREAASVLGYTETLWENDEDAPTETKDWGELTSLEREAATKLGYTAEIWDDDDSDSDDEKDTSPTLYCVQLYTTTPDYRLRVDDLKGLSMYANRPMKADEVILQSDVGPQCRQSLLKASASSEELPPERQAFAERFLQWQDKYGSAKAAGTTEAQTTIRLKDFTNPPSPGFEYTPPSPDQDIWSYNFELGENDIVLVEFVQRDDEETSSSALPPERRFEVLPFDEGIFFDKEENYSVTLNRPPTLFGQMAELEIPMHFSNHACGLSATAYDYFRLAEVTSPCPIVAPAQPSSFNKELEEYVRTHNFPESLAFNVVTTRRALEKGDELLTDYALWHWSNTDYMIGNGPSCFNPKASRQSIQHQFDLNAKEEEERYGVWMTPWFHCLCGDEKCHSASGFRGVKSFSLEEQKRLYWVLSPWVQSQIDWKVHRLESEEE